MKKLRKQFSKKNHGERFEKHFGKSQTIPNETHTIRDLLVKHTSGTLPPNIEREGQFQDEATFDSPDYQKINRLDIVDKSRFRQHNAQKIQEWKDEIKIQEQEIIDLEEIENAQPSANRETTEILDSGTLGSEADASGTQQNHSVSQKRVSKTIKKSIK